MVTSQDVARLAGVSQATVSRVLQGSAKVSPATRERVLAAMKQSGYHPNAAARAMRTRRAGTVGVVVADITNPFYPQLLEAVGDELDRAGHRMTLWNSTGPREASALEAIREGAVDGLLFTTVTEVSKPLEEALQRGEPVVLLHRGLSRRTGGAPPTRERPVRVVRPAGSARPPVRRRRRAAHRSAARRRCGTAAGR